MMHCLFPLMGNAALTIGAIPHVDSKVQPVDGDIMTAVAPSSLENAARPHLPPFRIAGYAAGDAGCNIAFQMTGLFLLVFYTNVVGIHPATAGSIFLFVKIWDAFADLFAGRMV